jgi:TRAP-type C4-dicarboxylate transport system permease small subunit
MKVRDITFGKIIFVMANGAGLFLFAVMLLVVADITGRAVYKPIQMGYELAELLLVFAIFLGFAYTQRERGFVRVEIALSHFTPPVKWIAEYITYIISILFFIALVWQTSLYAWESIQMLQMTGGTVPLPMYPSKCVIPLAGIFILVELFIELVQHHRGGIWHQK